jgi:hypothetical protein
MSKQKMLFVISERSFETMQQLAIVSYNHHKEKKFFCFESYFELVYKKAINYSLEYLKVDPEKYRDVYYKYFKAIYDISVNCGVYTSNRKLVFEYWKNNNKQFLKEIMDIYSINN